MKKKGLYQLKKSDKKIKEYTLSVLTEDKAGLLNHITIIFNRRKMNINSLNVSTTEVNGVSRFTIVVESTKEKIIKVVNHINKLIDVLAAFLYEEDEIYYQEIALYKLSSKILPCSTSDCKDNSVSLIFNIISFLYSSIDSNVALCIFFTSC